MIEIQVMFFFFFGKAIQVKEKWRGEINRSGGNFLVFVLLDSTNIDEEEKKKTLKL